MISLTNQIVEGLQETFEAREDSYKDVIVKEAYKELPKGKYPKVIVEEINNSEVYSRSTAYGERTTNLSYQITAYARDTEENNYVDAARFIMDIINEYITGNIAMRRLGDMAVKPYITDKTIMTCTQRYSCVYDKDTELVYKS
jgi:hypothetical protein